MSKNKARQSLFKTALRMIPMKFRAAPGINSLNLIFLTLRSLVETAIVIATQGLFDTITLAAGGQAGFGDCVIPLIVLAGCIVGREINNGAFWFTLQLLFTVCDGKFSVALYRKLQRVDPVRFEQPEFLDDVNKARNGIFATIHFSQFIFAMIMSYFLYFVTVGAYLFSLRPILLVTVLISFVPAFLTQLFRTKVFVRVETENAPLRRENEYYQKALCDREYYKETRILGAYSFFQGLFADTLRALSKKTWRAERRTSLAQLFLNVTSFASMGVSIYLMFTATMTGEISVGAFAAALTALNTLFNWMQQFIAGELRQVSGNMGRVYNFISVLDAPERAGADGEPDFARGVRAENVSFTYPGREEPALRDVSLAIENGETIAIVGENGAGKSTLVRLLTGIYRPGSGRVSIGGLDTASAAPSSLYGNSSGVFQKYQRYKMTLGDNVSISDVRAKADDEQINAALNEADAELGDGIALDTMLSPEFDGVDLSGGQWQRLAIARGLYRQSGFIVLDEPTSAIDPIEETRMYTQFQKLAAGKCAIVVTHRLGSAKLAHRIVVMDGGRIVDTGTHDELVSRPGKYADMWAAQAVWYER